MKKIITFVKKVFMTTATLNHILKEVDTIPVGRLEELYQLIHSLTPSMARSQSDVKRKKILSFAGAFSDMDEVDYVDFLSELKQTREKNFSRNIDL
jgi:negative regulator of replication initiation